MGKGQGKKRILIISLSVIAVLVVAGITWAIIAAQRNQAEPDPYVNQSTETETETEEVTPVEEESDVEVEEVETPTIDPATVSYVSVEPLDVDVAYVKGIPGFAFEVKRTDSSIQYVDFSSEDLAGTKCTDDTGVFASVIKNPQSDADRATLTSTKKVGNDTYGLSLPEAACTSDTELFEEYQDSFKNAFGLIRSLSATTEN